MKIPVRLSPSAVPALLVGLSVWAGAGERLAAEESGGPQAAADRSAVAGSAAVAWQFDRPGEPGRPDQLGAGIKPLFELAGKAGHLDDGESGGALALAGSLALGPFPRLTDNRYSSATLSGVFRVPVLPGEPQTLALLRDDKKNERVRLRLYPDGRLRFEDVATAEGANAATEIPWIGPAIAAGRWHTLTFGVATSWRGAVCWAFLDGQFAAEWLASGLRSNNFANTWEWRSPGAPLHLDTQQILPGTVTPKVRSHFQPNLPPWGDDPRLPDARNILLHAGFDARTLAPDTGADRLVQSPHAPEFVPGVVGQGLLLKNKAAIGFRVGDLPPERGTIALWIKPVDFNPTDQFGMRVFDGPGPISLGVRGGARKGMPFIFGDTYLKNIGWFEPNFPYGANEWVQVIVTWDAPSVSIYLNGRLFNAGEMNWDNVQVTQLGNPGWGEQPVLAFTGTNPVVVDEILALNTSVSKSEAEALYQRYTDPPPPRASGERQCQFSNLTYYPYEEKLTVAADLTKTPLALPAEVSVAVADAHGKALVEPVRRTVSAPGARIELISLPRPLPPGEYHVTVTATSQGQTVSQTQSIHRRAFGWLDRPVEASPRLLKPWTAIGLKDVKGKPVPGKARYEAAVWGRTYTLDALGFPVQMSSTQEEPTLGPATQPTLAAPVRLEVIRGGKTQEIVLGRSAVTSHQPHQLDIAAGGSAGGLAVENRVRLEFDGALFSDLTLRPEGDKPVAVERLRLVVPLRGKLARFLSVSTDKIRVLKNNTYLPDHGDGLVWGSLTNYWRDGGGIAPRAAWGKASPAWSGSALHKPAFGSLVPYLWVGDEDRGLCWWTATGRDWAFDPAADTIELRREGDALLLVVNLIQVPTPIDAPRTFSYGLMATPTKPRPPQWRTMISRTTGRLSPSVWARAEMDLAPSDGYVASVQSTDPLWSRASAKTDFHFQYTDFRSQAQGTPEWEYFKTVWAPHREGNPPAEHVPLTGFIPPDAFKDFSAHDPRLYSSGIGVPVGSNLHYRAYLLDWLIKNCGWNGIYQDDTYFWLLAWPLYGKGYVRPDGGLQPEYTMDWWREAMKRQHAVFESNGLPFPANILHVTGSIFASAMSFATILYDGEWGNHPGENCRDWLEKWNPDVLRASSIGRHLGLVPTWHPNQMTSSTDSKDEAAEYRRAQGSLLLHDIWRFGTLGAAIPGERERMAWANSGQTVTFHPYWARPAELATGSPSVLASAYRCAETGETLLTVVNYSDEERAVNLALPPAWLSGRTAWVAAPQTVTGPYEAAWQPAPAQGGSSLRVTVPGRDARVIHLKPPTLPAKNTTK